MTSRENDLFNISLLGLPGDAGKKVDCKRDFGELWNRLLQSVSRSVKTQTVDRG